MEHLSSCYFCGVAVETEVREYPIVPGTFEQLDLPPVDERPTVTLCSNCRHKLDQLLAAGVGERESIGGAEGARPSSRPHPDAGGQSRRRSEGDREAESREQAPARTAGDPGGETSDTAATGAESRSSDAKPEASDPESESEDADEATADAGSASNDHASADAGADEDGDDRSLSADAAIFEDVDPVPVGEDGTNEEDRSPDESEEPSSKASGDDSQGRTYTSSQAAGGRSRSHGTVGSDEQEETEDDDENEDDVPREAYNKVVRLLQNREFPVERGDILAVATNAYGLARSDCNAAIDQLIEREIIVEEDGEIYEAE